MTRRGGDRADDALRAVEIEPGVLDFAEGSCQIRCGLTRILVAASVLEEVPPWRAGAGLGWVTAEYDMLPRATDTRRPRRRGTIDGRSAEIQRLIGRSLRAVVDPAALGERTIHLDADVIQADGGTRTAAVTGAYVALVLAVRFLTRTGLLAASPLRGQVAAVSAGVVDGRVLLDLDREEDARAEVDANFIYDDQGRLIEVQATAEGRPFTRARLAELAEAAWGGAQRLMALQTRALDGDRP
jgi:ribonuclease PH